MPQQPPDRPILYLRGYAATAAEIDATVATPYMGFNLGSTRIRQSFDGKLVPFVFESPLVRLMKDEGYVDCYDGGAYIDRDKPAPAKSVWIFRYYEEGDEVSSQGKRRSILDFARDLRAFIERVRDSVCRNGAMDPADFKVHLVAHSMGGLIVRCYLQNLCVNAPFAPLVDKVFTYGTPHGGIEVGGMNVPDLGRLDGLDVGNFNRDQMREYLQIEEPTPVHSLNGAFPPERFFCFIGSNHRDYDAFFGLAKRGVGPMSDGLVLMKNAYTKDSPRAFAHRSHSGAYGLVNSEEGYQNLRRFLFGQVKVDVFLEVDEVTLPPEVAKAKAKGQEIRGKYHIDAAARVRNAGYQLSERRKVFGSEIRADYDEVVKQGQPIYLFSGYLDKRGKSEKLSDTALVFQVELAVEVPLFEIERRFWFDSHIEGQVLFREAVTFTMRPAGKKPTVRARLSSSPGAATEGRLLHAEDQEAPRGDGFRRYELPVGFQAGSNSPPKPGLRGRLVLHARSWE